MHTVNFVTEPSSTSRFAECVTGCAAAGRVLLVRYSSFLFQRVLDWVHAKLLGSTRA